MISKVGEFMLFGLQYEKVKPRPAPQRFSDSKKGKEQSKQNGNYKSECEWKEGYPMNEINLEIIRIVALNHCDSVRFCEKSQFEM